MSWTLQWLKLRIAGVNKSKTVTTLEHKTNNNPCLQSFNAKQSDANNISNSGPLNTGSGFHFYANETFLWCGKTCIKNEQHHGETETLNANME